MMKLVITFMIPTRREPGFKSSWLPRQFLLLTSGVMVSAFYNKRTLSISPQCTGKTSSNFDAPLKKINKSK